MKRKVSFCLIIHNLINLIFSLSSSSKVKNTKPALGVEILLKNATKNNTLTEKYKKRNANTAFRANAPAMVI